VPALPAPDEGVHVAPFVQDTERVEPEYSVGGPPALQLADVPPTLTAMAGGWRRTRQSAEAMPPPPGTLSRIVRLPDSGKKGHALTAASREGNSAPRLATPPATENNCVAPASSVEVVVPVTTRVAATAGERASLTAKASARGFPGAHDAPVGQDSRRVTCGRGSTATLPIKLEV